MGEVRPTPLQFNSATPEQNAALITHRQNAALISDGRVYSELR